MAEYVHAASREAVDVDPLAAMFGGPPADDEFSAPPSAGTAPGAPVGERRPSVGDAISGELFSDAAAASGGKAVVGLFGESSTIPETKNAAAAISAQGDLFGGAAETKKPEAPRAAPAPTGPLKGLDASKIKFKQPKKGKEAAAAEAAAGSGSSTSVGLFGPEAPTTDNRLGLGVDFGLGTTGASSEGAGNLWDDAVATPSEPGEDDLFSGAPTRSGLNRRGSQELGQELGGVQDLPVEAKSKLLAMEGEDDDGADEDISDLMISKITEREQDDAGSELFGKSAVARQAKEDAAKQKQKEVAALLNEDDILSKLDTVSVSPLTTAKAKQPAVAAASGGDDDLFSMLDAGSGAGADVVGDAAQFDFSSYISSQSDGNQKSGGLFD